jgi:hypothetical protein
LGSSFKIGLDYWSGRFSDGDRTLKGAHALLGWSERVVTLGQFSVQNAKSSMSETQSWFFFQKSSWEFTRGLWASLITDLAQFDQSDELTQRWKYGPGLQFFPRPHFELQFAYLRVKDRAVSEQEGDEAFVIFHYYL